MATKTSAKQAALRKAREKRLALDADRDARDRRVEEAIAEVLLLQDQRAEAEAALAGINQRIGSVIQRLLAEGIALDSAAEVTGLDRSEVRSLTRTKAAHDAAIDHRPDSQ